MVLIDDEEWLVEMMELAIRNEYKNIDLRAFQDSKKAWQELAQRDPDILITGANMGELSGEEIVRRLIEQKVPYPILVMSGWAPAEEWVKSFANRKSNISFLQKPFKIEQLHVEISNLLGRDDKPKLNVIGTCPKCGMEVLEGSTGYFCQGRECSFKIGGVILGQALNVTQVTKLLRDKRTDLLSGFVSKSGRQFSAWLVLDEQGKVTFDFPKRQSEEVAEPTEPTVSDRPRASDECKPLLEAATKDLFRKNSFRITGLSVDATAREVSRHADKLKMLAELGQDPHTQNAPFPMKPPPSLDEIREAIQKLKDPERRMVDEFFWFWPEEFGNSQSDPAMQALAKGDSAKAIEIWATRENDTTSRVTAKHNLALVYHVCALDWENYAVKNTVEADRREKMTNYWKGAFSRWEFLATKEHFWEQVVSRIRQLNEPNLPTGFARRMRATLPEALNKINAELAVAFAESGKIELARLHIAFMRETNQGLDNVEKTAELVLRPAINRFKDQIKHAKESANGAPQDGAKAAKELYQQAQRAAFLFDLFFGKENDLRNDLIDEAVAVCNRLQVVYHSAIHDDETCLEILNSVLPLATSIELRQQIEKNIAALKGFVANKKLEPVYALLKSIQDSEESPSVRLTRFKSDAVAAIVKAAGVSGFSENYGYPSSTSADFKELFDSAAIVLRGIALDAWNNHHDRQTAVAANDLAAKHATSPELKQRLAEDKKALQQMRYEADLEPITSAPSLRTINGIGCKLYGSTDTDPTTGSYLSTYYFVFFFIPLFPICRYRVTSSGNSYRFFGKAPLRSLDKWHLAFSIGLIILFFILVSSAGNGPTAFSPSSYDQTSPSAPAYTPPSAAPSAPTYTQPPTFGDGNSDGKVYRVPSSVSSTLASEKAEIESERTTLEALGTQIEQLGREIEHDRIYLDRTSQYDVDAFNLKVERYNALNQKAKIANAAFNEKVDNYNAKIQQSGR
jgi:DNA-binding response OmpR family regulator